MSQPYFPAHNEQRQPEAPHYPQEDLPGGQLRGTEEIGHILASDFARKEAHDLSLADHKLALASAQCGPQWNPHAYQRGHPQPQPEAPHFPQEYAGPKGIPKVQKCTGPAEEFYQQLFMDALVFASIKSQVEGQGKPFTFQFQPLNGMGENSRLIVDQKEPEGEVPIKNDKGPCKDQLVRMGKSFEAWFKSYNLFWDAFPAQGKHRPVLTLREFKRMLVVFGKMAEPVIRHSVLAILIAWMKMEDNKISAAIQVGGPLYYVLSLLPVVEDPETGCLVLDPSAHLFSLTTTQFGIMKRLSEDLNCWSSLQHRLVCVVQPGLRFPTCCPRRTGCIKEHVDLYVVWYFLSQMICPGILEWTICSFDLFGVCSSTTDQCLASKGHLHLPREDPSLYKAEGEACRVAPCGEAPKALGPTTPWTATQPTQKTTPVQQRTQQLRTKNRPYASPIAERMVEVMEKVLEVNTEAVAAGNEAARRACGAGAVPTTRGRQPLVGEGELNFEERSHRWELVVREVNEFSMIEGLHAESFPSHLLGWGGQHNAEMGEWGYTENTYGPTGVIL